MRVAVHGDALHHRGRTRLLLDRVLVVAVLQHVLLEESVRAGGGVAAVEADRLARPFAGEAELAPGRDVFLGAALRRDLEKIASTCSSVRHLMRVVLVDEDRERVDRRRICGRLVAVLLLELVDLGGLHLAGHRAELGGAGDQRRRRGRGALALDLDLDVRVDFLNLSAQNVIRLLRVSEPTLVRLPDTPLTVL